MSMDDNHVNIGNRSYVRVNTGEYSLYIFILYSINSKWFKELDRFSYIRATDSFWFGLDIFHTLNDNMKELFK